MAVTKGGRKRVYKDRKGNPIPSKTIRLSADDAFKAAHRKAVTEGREVGPATKRQEMKFKRGRGLVAGVTRDGRAI